MSARRVELMELLFLLAMVALFYFIVIPTGITDPDGFVLDEGLPPSFSARLVAWIATFVLLLRIARLTFSTGKPARVENAPSPTDDDSVSIEMPVSLTLRVWIGVAVAWLFAFGLVPVLGFAIGSVITLAVMLFVLGERSWVRLALFPLAVSVGVWLLFEQLLSVKLPVGMLLPLMITS